MLGNFYQQKTGWMHLFDPRTMIFFSFLLLVNIFLMNQIYLLVIYFIFLHLLLLSASISLARIYHLWKIVIPLMIMIGFSYPLFERQGASLIFQWKMIYITKEGITNGLLTSLRLPCILLAAHIPFLSHTQSSLIKGLTKIGIPYKIGLIITLTLRFLPYFQEKYHEIYQIQQMRGLNLKKMGLKARIPILISLIVSSLRMCNDLSYALESRGLGVYKNPSSMVILKFQLKDLLLLIFSFLLIIIIGYYI